MMLALLLVGVQALDSTRGQLRGQLLRSEPKAEAEAPEEAKNETEPTPIAWESFVGDYCGSFCNMTGVDAGKCTVCSQRLNFTVEEGKLACAVACQGVQTDRVTEEVVDCERRLDACMFKDVDTATCNLECGTASSAAKRKECDAGCKEFKRAQRELGHPVGATFFGPHTVKTVEEQKVNVSANETELQNVTVRTVQGVEPLPVAKLDRADPVKAEYRFHVNESAWLGQPKTYCDAFYCNAKEVGVAGVDAYHCVECVNRLNNSIEHGLLHCRVGCEMKETDSLTDEQAKCGDACLNTAFDGGACYLECALPMNKAEADCQHKCIEAKADQRAAGLEVRPFNWPAPPAANVTNASESNTTAEPEAEKTEKAEK